MNYLIAALLAMCVTVMLIPPLTALAGRLGVVDLPGGRKLHAAPIPRIGGIAMAAGMLLAMLLMGQHSRQSQGLLLGLIVLLPFGIQDDRLALSPSIKLIGQVLAACCVIWMGDVQISMVKHVEEIDLPTWLSLPLTIAFIVGVTNAVNLADGLDGLAGGATLLCLSGLLVLALTVDSMQVVFACVVIIAALIGFLRYNNYPAKIFMGDTGSQVLGFSAAVLSLMLTQDKSLPLSPAIPLLLLGVPVIDTLTVMTERILAGRSPFAADRNHVHHRLLAFGFAHHEVVIAIYSVQAVMMVLAWYLRFASDAVIVSVFALMALLIVGTLRLGRARGWHWRSPEDKRLPLLSRVFAAANARGWFARTSSIAAGMICVLMLVYALLVTVKISAVSWDMRLLGAGAAILLLIGFLRRHARSEAGWLERVALYVGAVLMVALDRRSGVGWSVVPHEEAALFAILLAALLVKSLTSPSRRFSVSPLDVLVLLLAVVLPNLPGSTISQYLTTPMLLKALMLMYGVESLAEAGNLYWRVVVGGMLLCLSTVAMRGA